MINATSNYARKFDESCLNWSDDAEFNQIYLKAEEVYFNTLLRHRGYVFLRDIYEKLGFPIDDRAIVVGWFYDLKNGSGDNFVSFDAQQIDNTPDFMLDFNVDGNILGRFVKE